MATSIPSSLAMAEFTNTVISTFNDSLPAYSFLRSFFKNDQSFTKYITIAVEREYEAVAVDVKRGTPGNMNTFDISTEKTFLPPYYREKLVLSDQEGYDRLTGSGMIDSSVFTQIVARVIQRLNKLRAKIERAYEIQCSQVLQTGIVTLQNGTNIDFKRKAESMVDVGGGNYFASSSSSPVKIIESMMQFVREQGKAGGSMYNLVFGRTAWNDFLDNESVQKRADIKGFDLMNVREPQRVATGGTLHGRLVCGSYSALLWTFPQSYDNASGVATPYIDDKNVVVLPEDPKFLMAFAAVPKLVTGKGMQLVDQPLQSDNFTINDWISEENDAHMVDIKSAGVAVPVAVDQIGTIKAVA